MAKKKHSVARHHKKRRMGAKSMLNPNGPVVKIAATAAGYLMADAINAQIDKIVPASMLPAPSTTTTTAPTSGAMNYLVPAVQAGAGALLLFKGRSSLVKSAVGGLLLGSGLKRGLKTAGVISGYQSVPVIGRRRMHGYQSVPVIGGTPGQLQGAPDQLQGYTNRGAGVNGYTNQGSGVMGALYMDSTGSGINETDR